MSEYINVVDSFDLTIPTRKLTDEGYLQANAALTKVGIQKYDLSNITGKSQDAGKIVNVFRPKETVFHEKTIESSKMKPITMNHPHENVNSSNYYNYSVGMIGERVQKLDDERLGANIQIIDKSIVNDVIDNKLKELSCGYNAKIIPKQGTYNGVQYDYEFSGAMIMNHCAIVDKGRCGESVSILDKKEENLLMNEQNVDQNPEIKDELINDEKKDKKFTDYDKMKKALLGDDEFIGTLYDKLKKHDIKDSGLLKDKKFSDYDKMKKALLGDDEFIGTLYDKLKKHDIKDSGLLKDKKFTDYDKMKKALLGDDEFIGTLYDKLKQHDIKDSCEVSKTNTISDKDIFDQEQIFKDKVNFRVNLIEKAKKLIVDENITDLSNREILEKSLSKSNVTIKDKSDDYLLGVLDSLVKDHQEAKKYFDENTKNGMNNYSPRYFGATEIRKL